MSIVSTVLSLKRCCGSPRAFSTSGKARSRDADGEIVGGKRVLLFEDELNERYYVVQFHVLGVVAD